MKKHTCTPIQRTHWCYSSMKYGNFDNKTLRYKAKNRGLHLPIKHQHRKGTLLNIAKGTTDQSIEFYNLIECFNLIYKLCSISSSHNLANIFKGNTTFGTGCDLPHRQMMYKPKPHIAKLVFSTTRITSAEQPNDKLQQTSKSWSNLSLVRFGEKYK